MTALTQRLPLLLLVLLGLVVIGLDLGGSSLHNQDEALHAVIAREAASDGNWLPLTYMGRPYYNKPPLRIWLTALTFKAAGVSEWTVRLWSGVFGLATVVVLYLLGRRLYGERTGLLAALILLTSHQYIYNHCVRTGETDSMLIFCWTSGLLLLQLATTEGNRKLLYLSAVALGLCGMVKHLGFIPIVLLIAIGYLLLSGALRTFPWRAWLAALGMLLAIALPWHLMMWAVEGRPFVQKYLLGEVVKKRLEARGGGPGSLPTGTWSSFATLARGFFPWSCLLPFAILAVPRGAELRRRWLMPLLWLGVAMGVTVLSGRKFSWYVLPALPAAAILVAGLLDRFLADTSSLWLRFSVAVGALVALTSLTNAARHNPFGVMARDAMLSVHFLGRLRGPDVPAWASLGILALLLALVGVAYRLAGLLAPSKALRRSGRWATVAALVCLALHTVIVPLQFRRTRLPLDQISSAAQSHLAPGEPLNVMLPNRKRRNPRFNYYLGGLDLRRVNSEDLATDVPAGQLLLTDVASMESLQEARAELASTGEPLAQARGLLLLRLP